QAEDGIRDFHVTGVQTCALPILAIKRQATLAPISSGDLPAGHWSKSACCCAVAGNENIQAKTRNNKLEFLIFSVVFGLIELYREIGRASCRGRVESSARACCVKR